MASTSSTTRPRDPGRRVVELRAQGHSSQAIREDLRAAGYPEATIANAVPGNQPKPKPAPKPAPVELAPASTPVDEADELDGDEPITDEDAARFHALDTSAEPPRTAREGATMPRLSIPSGGDAAGFVLGVFGMALVVNYMRGGPDQVKAWARAKFLNDASGYASPATQGRPGTGAANIYNVHAAMTNAQYNTAHPTGAGTSQKGGKTP